MARAAAEFDLRRTIVYHPRIARSRAFTEVMPAILTALPATNRPDRPVTCHHVDGRRTSRERRAVFADLADIPGEDHYDPLCHGETFADVADEVCEELNGEDVPDDEGVVELLGEPSGPSIDLTPRDAAARFSRLMSRRQHRS